MPSTPGTKKYRLHSLEHNQTIEIFQTVFNLNYFYFIWIPNFGSLFHQTIWNTRSHPMLALAIVSEICGFEFLQEKWVTWSGQNTSWKYVRYVYCVDGQDNTSQFSHISHKIWTISILRIACLFVNNRKPNKFHWI